MWQNRLDVYWDGGRELVVGLFEEESGGGQGFRPELAVASAKYDNFDGAALIDLIDGARWRGGCCLIQLPRDHRHVAFRADDGSELKLTLIDVMGADLAGEWSLLLAEQTDNLSSAAIAFRSAALPARGDFDRQARDQIQRSGPKLFWAASQLRRFEAAPASVGANVAAKLQLWPAQRIFPAHQSRIVIEALEYGTERPYAPLKAPFAIMEHWLRENGAPQVTLRVRIQSLEQAKSFLARTAVVQVMHQRRRIREWMQEQKDTAGAVVDLLTREDLRQATGQLDEQPEAVSSPRSALAHNLLQLILSPTPHDGVVVRQRSDAATALAREIDDAEPTETGLVVDIEFFGATLGDDVGLVCTSADIGDFGVMPSDPGGVRCARLFRVEGDGLTPRGMTEGDPLLQEVLRLAADEEGDVIGALNASPEKALSVQEKRQRLLARLTSQFADQNFTIRFDPGKMWDIFEPVLLSSFAALIADISPQARAFLHKIGGYEAYRIDPALVHAVGHQYELAVATGQSTLSDKGGEAKSILYRFLDCCSLTPLVEQGLDLAGQIRIWRQLTTPTQYQLLESGAPKPSLAQQMIAARIAFDGAKDSIDRAEHAVALLANEAMVERAAIYCDDWEYKDKADWLRGYLEHRRANHWISQKDAQTLALIVEEADAYWREIESGRARTPPPPPSRGAEPQQQKTGGLMAAVRTLFGREAPRTPEA